MPRRSLLLFVLFAGLLTGRAEFPAALAGAPAPNTAGVSGLVRDQQGRLLEGARVRLSLRGRSFLATTGADGVYRFVGLPVGEVDLRATYPGHAPDRVQDVTTLPGETVRVDLTLRSRQDRSRGVIAGRVLDALGKPVPGAGVEVLTGASVASARTGRAGRFRLGGLAPGSYTLCVRQGGSACAVPAPVEVAAGAPTHVEIRLDDPVTDGTGVIFGVVRNHEGHPLPGALVQIVAGPAGGSTVAGPEGHYELPGLPPGTYAVRASLEGYWGQTWDGIRLEADHEVRVDFALRRSGDGEPRFGRIAGTVRDHEGHPIPGALVEVVEGPTARRAETDAEGRFVMEEMRTGAYLLRASKAGYRPDTEDGRVEAGRTLELHFVLERILEHGRIAGTVRDPEGHPIAGALVAVLEGPTLRQAETGHDGAYVLAEMAPGAYRVRASKAGYRSAVREGRVEAGHTLELHFVLEPEVHHGRLVGRVTDREGHGLAGVLVEILGIRSTLTGPEGGFEFNEVAPGVYAVRFSKTGYQAVTRHEVVVRAGETTRLEVVLEPEGGHGFGRIVGTVRNAAGTPLAEARVRIAQGPVIREVFTGPLGRYELNELPAGTYRLVVSRPGYRSAESDAISLAAGQTREVNFTLHPAE